MRPIFNKLIFSGLPVYGILLEGRNLGYINLVFEAYLPLKIPD